MKKILFLIFSVTLFSIISIWSYRVYQLKNSYVLTSFNEENKAVQYTFQSERPENWIPLSQLPKNAYMPIVISEDWGFYLHSGIDWNQIKRSFEDWIFSGERLRGASTITQQLIKNLFFSNERSMTRKVQEALLAPVIEKFVGKKKILETYLNIIEYGEGLYGIENASLNYFNKSAKSLHFRQGAFLAMLLPNPKKYAQSFKDKELTEYGAKTVKEILEKLVVAKILTPEQKDIELRKRFYWEKPLKARSEEIKADLDYYSENE